MGLHLVGVEFDRGDEEAGQLVGCAWSAMLGEPIEPDLTTGFIWIQLSASTHHDAREIVDRHLEQCAKKLGVDRYSAKARVQVP